MAKRKRKTHRIAVLDFETDPFKKGREPAPFCGGIFDGEVYRYFWGESCVEDIVEYIKDELQGYTIYAHNGGKFDYFFMLPYLDENVKLINGRIARATIGDAILTDSYLILPLPLSAHAKEIFDYTKMEEDVRHKHKPEILSYLKSDCIYLHEWVSKFVNMFGMNLTIAGTAYKELRKTGYDQGNTPEWYDNLFRPFYFGGRVQTFKKGVYEGNFEYVDINSAYPRAMLEKHPYGSKYKEKLRIPDDENGGYFAHITAVSNGALPHRDEKGKLQFSNEGKALEYFCTGWEIIAGLETGTLKILKVHRVYYHSQKKDFKEFVHKFYDGRLQAKKEGDDDLVLFLKLILNSCYGKFGQDGRQFKDFQILPSNTVPESYFEDRDDPDVIHKWRPHSEHELGMNIWQRDAPVDRFNNVATAASITGYVRAFLWRSICESENPLYCDTDSIMCEKFHGKMGDDLGEWKLEANLLKVWIGGRKFYAALTDDFIGENKLIKKACKGAPLTFSQITNEIENGGGVLWEKDAPSYSLKYGARFLSREIRRQGEDFEYNVH